MKFEDLVDQDALATALENKWINIRYADDGQRIYNYSDLAMFDKGAWENSAVLQCRGLIVSPSGDVIARPFAKFFNHNQPEAGVLDPDALVEVTDKVDGCFPSRTRLALWGGGTVYIGDVVKNKLDPVLIGRDESGSMVPTRITRWFDNGLKSDWMRIGLSCPASLRSGSGGHPNRMYVTPNHHIERLGEYVPAGELRVGDEVSAHVVTFEKLDLFLGGLLGDGSVCRNGGGFNYQECHGEGQREYTEDQKSLFIEGLVNVKDTRGGYANTVKVWLQTRTAEVFKSLREEWYPNGVKEIPKDLSFLNDAVVAKWFMDDGSRVHSEVQQDRALFHTNGFTEADVRRLAAALQEQYGVSAKVFNAKGWTIRVNYSKGSINTLWAAMAPYVFPSMQYKLPKEYRGKFTEFPSPEFKRARVAAYVTSVDYEVSWQGNHYGAARCRAYDIETETHNYLANGVLVHNSLGIIHRAENGSLRVATRGSFCSDQAIHATKILNERNYINASATRDVTPLVEIIYPENRIVVDYQGQDDLILLGYVHKETGRYEGPGALKNVRGWRGPMTKTFRYDNLREALAAPPREGAEGLCVRFVGEDKIVKIKQEDYVALHKIVTGLSERSVWEHMVAGKPLSELICSLPDELHVWTKEVWMDLSSQASNLLLKTSLIHSDILSRVSENDRKAYAAEAMKYSDIRPYLFMQLDNNDPLPAIIKSLKPKGDTRAKVFKEDTA